MDAAFEFHSQITMNDPHFEMTAHEKAIAQNDFDAIALNLGRHNHQTTKMYKSLKWSDDPDYVLIHKKALLVNALAYAHMSKLLSRLLKATDSDFTGENLAQEVGNVARGLFNSLSLEEVNANVQAILDNIETESGLTIFIPNA